MKRILFILIFLVIYITTAFAQTEVWRHDGWYTDPIKANDGNLYILQNTVEASFGVSNTLKRITPNGDEIWSRSLNMGRNMIVANPKGVYMLTHQDFPQTDTISCIDSSGALLWQKAFTQSGICVIGESFGVLQPSFTVNAQGNLVIALRSYTPSLEADSLLVITPDGNITQRSAIPNVSLKNKKWTAVERFYYSPIDDGNGSIWLFSSTTEHFEKSTGTKSESYTYQYLHGFRFHSTSGALLKKKLFLAQLQNNTFKEKPNNSESLEEGFMAGVSVTDAGGVMLITGQHSSVKNKQTATKTTYSISTDWLWYTVTPSMKITKTNIKGKGTATYKNDSGTETGVHNESDFLEASADGNGYAYFLGKISKGKTVNDVGTYKQNTTVVKFDTKKNKIIWKYDVPTTDGYSATRSFITDDNKLFVSGNQGGPSKTIYVVTLENTPSSSSFSLPKDIMAPYLLTSESGDKNLYGLFVEHPTEITSAYFFAKYSFAGLFSSSLPTHSGNTTVEQFSLSQNYPNPFNPATLISYTLPAEVHVSLTIFNMLGQEVATLVNEVQTAGEQEIHFDGANLPSGVYMYRIKAGNFTETKRMLLIK